jgi:hypothetical protein
MALPDLGSLRRLDLGPREFAGVVDGFEFHLVAVQSTLRTSPAVMSAVPAATTG